MKIILFTEEKEVIEEIRDVEEAEPVGTTEVSWKNGGRSGIEQNYVILHDEEVFEELTESDFLDQRKTQELLEAAREYEENRVLSLALGYEEEAAKNFEETRASIKGAANREAIFIARKNARDNRERRNSVLERKRPDNPGNKPEPPENPGTEVETRPEGVEPPEQPPETEPETTTEPGTRPGNGNQGAATPENQ
jgi:hypothetical protein